MLCVVSGCRPYWMTPEIDKMLRERDDRRRKWWVTRQKVLDLRKLGYVVTYPEGVSEEFEG